MIFAIAVAVGSTFLMGFGIAYWMLILARTLQGKGSSISN
jgi:hypothetical protein